MIEDCSRQLKTTAGVRIIGNPKERARVVSFVLEGMKTEDVGKALSNDGIAVRSGHHCVHPILRRMGWRQVYARLSRFIIPMPNNTHADIDALICSLHGIKSRLQQDNART